MMTENIKKFNEEVDELMSIGMAATMNASTIEQVSAEEFALVQKAMKTFNLARTIMMEQAEMLDSMDKKLDKLLAKKN